MPLGALLLALLVSPEQQVAPPVLAPETASVYRLGAASDGDGWLVVRGEWGVVANRLDRDGRLLERLPIAIGDGNSLSSPAVAWGAGRYLVAWTEHDTVRAELIDSDGNQSPSFVVSAKADTTQMRQISCAFDGSRFLIVWSEANVPNRTAFFRTKFAAIVDPSGHVVATDISLGDGLSMDPFALAAGRNEFLVATGAGDTFAAFTITDDGHITHRALGSTDNSGRPPYAAFNGSEYLVLWGAGKAAIVRNGVVAPVAPLSFAPASLTAIGSRFIATTAATAGALRAVSLDENGAEQQSSAVAQIDNIPPVAAAWNGSALLVSYARQTAGTGTAYARLVDATGAPIAPETTISFAPPSQIAPAIAAANDREALTVWAEHEEASIEYRARAALLRDGAAGDVIDLGPSAQSTSVAFGASTYFAVWSRHDGDHYLIEGRRVARDGTPLDAAPLQLMRVDIAQPAAVAFDGENFVVASVIYQPAAALGDVIAIRVRPDGTVLDPQGIVVHHATGVQRMLNAPLIASNGASSSLILWWEQRQLFAATLGGGATKIADLVEVAPSVAWTGTTYIVSWTDIFAHALRWAALDASGNAAGTPGALPLTAANPLEATATARLGDGALIAWVDITAGPTAKDILALRVSANGMLLGEPFTVAASGFAETAIAAAGGGGGARLVYQRAIDFPGSFQLPRVFTRAVTEAAPRRRAAAR